MTRFSSWVLVGLVLWLLKSLIHGPGRGMSLVPADHFPNTLAILPLITAGMFITGLSTLTSRPRWAAWLLGGGLLLRMAQEILFSPLRLIVSEVFGTPSNPAFLTPFGLGFVGVVMLYYLVSFIAPALIFLETVRKLRHPGSDPLPPTAS